MSFNVNKCSVLHLCYNNKEYDYKLGCDVIRSSATEKDLGVFINRSGKSSEQCILAARKANTVTGMIKRNISFKSKDAIVRLYNT